MRAADPAPNEPFRLGHRPWLDGLRGVAVLIVLAGHLHLVPGGFIGVDLFLVLSGFLITALLAEERERTGAIGLKHFYLRRALRLAPALVVVVAVSLAFAHLFRSAEEAAVARREALIVGCHIANWPKLYDGPLPALGHTWSLALEEQFYAIWPLLLCAVLRFGSRRGACLLVLAGIAGSCAWRFALHREYRAAGRTALDVGRMYMGLDTRADALLVGCLIGLLAVWGRLPRNRTARLAVGVAATATAVWVARLVATQHLGKPQFYDGQFTLLALALAAVVVHPLVNPAPLWRRVLELPPLVALGRISYGLYLVHIPVIHWVVNDEVGPAHPRTTAVAAGATLGAALLLFYLVERPFLRLKSRLRPDQGAAPARAEPPAKLAA